MKRLALCCVFLALALAAPMAIAEEATLDQMQTYVHDMHATYDLKDAEAALAKMEDYIAQDTSPEANLLLARAALQVANLRREIYEKEDLEINVKRDLGTAIDAAAGTGHAALENAPETSERYRIEADLWATMMRTQWKGNKFKDAMDAAINKAAELNPDNAMVYVTKSKRQLFAKERHGGDLEEAVDTLNKAVELEPDNVPARLFRGIAYEKLDNLEAARADWQKALDLNPKCRPAREYLERTAA